MSTIMSWEQWTQYDALGLAELVNKGDVRATELGEQVKEAVALINPSVHSVVEIFQDSIDNPEKEGTNLSGIFAGVPFLMKDLGPTVKGRLQEFGSLFLQGNKAHEDAFLTSKIKNAGLNIIGRTTTPEFGVCSSAENKAVYTTKNPWNVDYTSLGSSAGTAVSIASGILPLAHGTDGGGSIRIPAGSNGLIGLKCSRGVFSIGPHLSDLSGLVSTQGCLSKTVRDTACFVDQCRGGAPGEFMPYWQSDDSYLNLIKKDPKPLKIALSHEWGQYKAIPEYVEELTKLGKFLAGLGHQVEWVTPPIDFEAAYHAQTICYISNFAQMISHLLKAHNLSEPPDNLIEPINIKIWQEGKNMSYTQRWDMQDVFNRTARAMGNFFEQWDIVLTPITTNLTPKLGTSRYLSSNTEANVWDWFYGLWELFAYTPLANLCGTPGISLPLAFQSNGIPLGMHAQTKQGNDGLLLQLAAQIERAIDGKWNQGKQASIHV